ncbi:hypothetical protein GU926_05635 [Nibribacter ruber]|uniref:DUF5777 domain-containing protein n=2 Tax=Nibribacter ruber TaxID=2698458 RepID=A0A6P1P4Q7_9BACT|nr:hypothetical protein GU926_05635 [Nibribacter ruber]
MVTKSQAQDDLLKLAETQDSARTGHTTGTFKATRLLNGHTVQTNGAGALLFLISHRFGTLNSGAYEFWGLDQATIRLGLEYGLTDQLTVGVGRSSLEKTYDGFLKYKLLQQQEAGMPITLTLFTSTAIKTLEWFEPNVEEQFKYRLTYTFQALVARKLTDRVSLQVAPTLVHRNLVPLSTDENNVYAVGAGGRFKLTKRTTFNAEYFYLLPGATADQFRNSLSLGVDIETGGHVFQLMATNSQGMIEQFFIPSNAGSWSKGDIYFGFNISRVFQLKEK